MSRALIRKALETNATAVTGALPIAGENSPFNPSPDMAYQRFNLMFSDPDNSMLTTAQYIEQGVFQIMLCYPRDNGAADLDAMADLVRVQFKRATTLICDDGVQVFVTRTPSVGQPVPGSDNYEVPVSIRFQALVPVASSGGSKSVAAVLLDLEHDNAGGFDYIGSAPHGSATSASVWTINRIAIAADGTSTVGTASAVKWDDRLTVTYT